MASHFLCFGEELLETYIKKVESRSRLEEVTHSPSHLIHFIVIFLFGLRDFIGALDSESVLPTDPCLSYDIHSATFLSFVSS